MRIKKLGKGGGRIKLNTAIFYILISVMLSVMGQLFLKKGMDNIGTIVLSFDQVWNTLLRIFTNPFIVSGLIFYVGGTIFWLFALSMVELSYAYPYASLSYIFILIASWLLFHEDISFSRLLGTLVIGLGIYLVSRN
jgi:drug/metabolite transporter (DMT)-like permease